MSLPATMSGVVLTRHGGPDALAWRDDLPVPVPGPGQAVVQVLAAGVNNTDIATREGWYARESTGAGEGADPGAGGWAGAIAFPRVQGGDLCGRVVALGPGVAAPGIGRRVTCPINLPRPNPGNPVGFIALGSEIDGAFAQFCRMEAADLHDVTRAPLSDIEIAAMPCAFGTAGNLLDRAGVGDGQRVLVTGASGGVGLAAVQLATLRGALVTGVAAEAKAEAVREAGAGEVIGRDAVPEHGRFDAVIDLVGGPGWPALIRALKPGGHYAVSGAIAGPVVAADLRDIYLRDITLHGCTFQPPESFRRLVDLMNAGRLRPLVSATYPLSHIARAQADFAAKRLPGKLVLIPDEVPA
jgi:NADPH:quinone reductase-like Zn-dependent oxidoreductase